MTSPEGEPRADTYTGEALTDVPEGVFTFLFTDIEGSSRRWDDFPAAMTRALERHDQLLRHAVESHRGHVFKTVGDAVYAAFASAADAASAAMDGQRAIHLEDWAALADGFPSMRIRAGLHTGGALLRDGDYFGPTLNRVARLVSAARGGQILMSSATRGLLAEPFDAGVEVRDWGEHRLRDLRHTEHIYQLVPMGLPDVRERPATASSLAAPDRVLVVDDEDGAARSKADGLDSDALSAMLRALRSDHDELRLTADVARSLARRHPSDLDEYRLGRIAEWSLPQHRLDRRFVQLALIVDQGEAAPGRRWREDGRRFPGLVDALSAIDGPAAVLLGSPGSGKSTLLRQLELETSATALRGETDVVSFFAQLNHYWADDGGGPTVRPGEWLSGVWSSRYPALPGLDQLLARGGVLLLLDGLNEMPHESAADYRDRVRHWKRFLHDAVAHGTGNRALFSCRSLDYSATLSTRAMRVPQLHLEKMTDAQVRRFVELHSPARAAEIWTSIETSPQLELMRTPFFLRLMIEQVEAGGDALDGRAALFTGCVRLSLRREVERDNPLFASGELLSERDLRQIVASRAWKSQHALPHRGPLLPAIGRLAFGMQDHAAEGESSQVRVRYDEAHDLIGHELAADIIECGEALGVLIEDTENDEVLFFHQLLQEYFAARQLTASTAAREAAAPWRSTDVRPGLSDVLRELAPADPLPPLPSTRWDESVQMAAAMCERPDSFVRQTMKGNLPLAGRCAAQPDVRLPSELATELRWSLVERSRDMKADLRARILAGRVLGRLGDPRFELRTGSHGQYILPPMVPIDAGEYEIGLDQSHDTSCTPRHAVTVESFSIGQFPVTVAEWSLFIAAGAYDDERWWDTDGARAWRRGEGTSAGARSREKHWRAVFQADPDRLEEMFVEGLVPQQVYEQWREKLRMSSEAFEAHLVARFPSGRKTQPEYYDVPAFGNPAQPVVGVCWFEACAYCNWVAAQSGWPLRLPTETEWEAAARGREGRRFPWGDDDDLTRCNAAEAHVRGTTPVGVFPDGDTPDGIADLAGNSCDWTGSLWGRSPDVPEFQYPVPNVDGRNTLDAPVGLLRINRGGSWGHALPDVLAALRGRDLPDSRGNNGGLRLALSGRDGTGTGRIET